MIFVSPVFLFLFLPCVLLVNFLLRWNRKLQNLFLLLSSLFFYLWGEPRFSLMLMLSIAVNWLIALGLERAWYAPAVRKALLAVALLFNIGLLFLYKYWDFFASTLNALLALRLPLRRRALPIGISFFTFQALSYVIDVYRAVGNGQSAAQKNPLNVGLYISFFPQLVAGPIVRYETVAQEIRLRRENAEDFQSGVLRFMTGFSKKVLLANTMAVIADRAFAASPGLTGSLAWLGAFSYTMQIYYDFSGYSDMAIGMGRMFGFHFEENFNRPYTALSVTDFWRRWHISLSSWFRDYVYIPLGGNRCSRVRNLLNLFLVWLLTGIWHGANWTFLVWGLFYFVILMLEKQTGLNAWCRAHPAPGRVYTFLVVMLAWVLFRADSLADAGAFLAAMFGRGPFWQAYTGVLIRENLLPLAAASAFAFLPTRRKPAADLLRQVLLLLAFSLSIVYMINGTYNPFIYFNF